MGRRIPILFSDAEMDRLRRVAQRHGVSLAAVVREAVNRYVLEAEHPDRTTLYARSWAVVGAFASGGADGSTAHDRHLADAFQT